MPRGQGKPRSDCDIVVEVFTRIRKAEAAAGATGGEDGPVGMNTLTGRQLHTVTAPWLGREARGIAKFQIGAGVARRQGQCLVECATIEVQRGAVGREDVVPSLPQTDNTSGASRQNGACARRSRPTRVSTCRSSGGAVSPKRGLSKCDLSTSKTRYRARAARRARTLPAGPAPAMVMSYPLIASTPVQGRW